MVIDKRLFVAIEISEELKNELLKISSKYQDKDIRWTKDKNLHITVQFLGNIKSVYTKQIEQELDDIAQNTNRFRLTIDKIIYAPPGETKNMIWVVLSDGSGYKNLTLKISNALRKYIDNNLLTKDKNVMREQRTAHITLARFKSYLKFDDLNLENIRIQNKELEVGGYSLWESFRGSRGTEYKILKKFKFKNV